MIGSNLDGVGSIAKVDKKIIITALDFPGSLWVEIGRNEIYVTGRGG